MFNLSTLKSTVVQYNSWHPRAGTHVLIFESLQLEGSYVGDLLYSHTYCSFCSAGNTISFYFTRHCLQVCVSFSERSQVHQRSWSARK